MMRLFEIMEIHGRCMTAVRLWLSFKIRTMPLTLAE